MPFLRHFCQLPQNEGAEGGFAAGSNEQLYKLQFDPLAQKTEAPEGASVFIGSLRLLCYQLKLVVK